MHAYVCACVSAAAQADVEGYEPRVVAGASQLLLRQRLVDNLLLEYSPHTLERYK